MIVKFENFINEKRLTDYIKRSEQNQKFVQSIKESSEFNQYQLGIDNAVSTFGPGWGWSTDPGLSIYSPDSNPYVDFYARSAGSTSRLMQIIQQVSKEMIDDHIFARKSDRFLEEIDEYKNIKILRIFKNEALKLNVYISFDFMDQEFFGVFRNFNASHNKPTFDTELLSDPKFKYIDKEYYLKLNQYIYKLIYNWFIPKAGMYKNLKQDCPLKDEMGQQKYMKEGKIVEIKGYNTDENGDPYITLEIEGKKYNIVGNNYFFFNYWFEPITVK
jgi:hypothetical protein